MFRSNKLNKKEIKIVKGLSERKKKIFDLLLSDRLGLCPEPINANAVIDMLSDYLLGENFYIAMPLNGEQANAVILDRILSIYSNDYTKEINAYIKYKKDIDERIESIECKNMRSSTN